MQPQSRPRVSRGLLLALSTPFGQRGWFHEAWQGDGDWERVKVTAEQCPRIPAAFPAEERQALGERWFRQEYLCSLGIPSRDKSDAVKQVVDTR